MPYSSNSPSIDASKITWEPAAGEGNPRARLLSHIRVCGLDMHLEAWEVEYDGDLQNVTEDSGRSDDFLNISGMMDCSFETVEIEGREYFLIATPYGR